MVEKATQKEHGEIHGKIHGFNYGNAIDFRKSFYLMDRGFACVDNSIVFRADCIGIMEDLSYRNYMSKFNLVFADPPFGIGFDYGDKEFNDNLPPEVYKAFALSWVNRAVKLLSNHGSFFLAISDEYVADYKLLLDSHGLTMRNWIIWYYSFGTNCKKKFARTKTHILYYVKDPKNFTFNDSEIRVPSKRQETGDKRACPKGKIPDDVWNFSRLCGNFNERTEHPCQMPEAVLERIIRATTNPGDWVLDPFAGSGTTLAVARSMKRKFIGIEKSVKFSEIIRDRLTKRFYDPDTNQWHYGRPGPGDQDQELANKPNK